MFLSHQPPPTPIYPYANQPYAETWPAYHEDPGTESTNIEAPFNYFSQGVIAGTAQLAGFDDFPIQYPEKTTEGQTRFNQWLTFDGRAVVSNNVGILSHQEGLSRTTNDSFLQTEPEGQNRQSNPPKVLFSSPQTYTCNSPSFGFDDNLPPFTESTSLSQPIEMQNSVSYELPFSFPVGNQNLEHIHAPALQRQVYRVLHQK
jgi:hypothetical protein